MATRIPLVVGASGLVQQLQSGDQIVAPLATTDVRTYTNGESSTAIVVGAPVYSSAAGSVKRGKADATSTSFIIGLGYDASISASASGNIAVGGVLNTSTANWDAVTGGSGGLTFNAPYFLDPSTAGKLTVTAPSTVGQSNVLVGIATSTQDMELKFQPPILL